jgi:hypothetical protein
MPTSHCPRFKEARAHSPWLRPRSIAVILALFVFAQLFALPEGHAQESHSEYQVKAAYLFNFLKFVEWP